MLLHEFVNNDSSYQMLDNENVLDFMNEKGDTPFLTHCKAKLQQLVRMGQKFTYLYDFGANWRHIVKVEAIETRAEPVYSATILHGERVATPEDVEGPDGYEGILDIIHDCHGSDEETECLEWAGGAVHSGYDRTGL